MPPSVPLKPQAVDTDSLSSCNFAKDIETKDFWL